MAKKVLLVGHCGPDSGYLAMAVRSAVGEVEFLHASNSDELSLILDEGVDLVLLNRLLGYSFSSNLGVELIRQLKPRYPSTRMMLVSNYPDAQATAVAAGALPGFGKRDIGTHRVTKVLNAALATEPV